jgi:hypothetical protein
MIPSVETEALKTPVVLAVSLEIQLFIFSGKVKLHYS